MVGRIMSVMKFAVSILDGFVDIVMGPKVYEKGWTKDPVVGKSESYKFPSYSSRPAFDPNVKEITLLVEKYPNGIYMTTVRKAARDVGFDHFIMTDAVSAKPIWETELPYNANMRIEKYVTDGNNIVSDENIGTEV